MERIKKLETPNMCDSAKNGCGGECWTKSLPPSGGTFYACNFLIQPISVEAFDVICGV